MISITDLPFQFPLFHQKDQFLYGFKNRLNLIFLLKLTTSVIVEHEDTLKTTYSLQKKK